VSIFFRLNTPWFGVDSALHLASFRAIVCLYKFTRYEDQAIDFTDNHTIPIEPTPNGLHITAG